MLLMKSQEKNGCGAVSRFEHFSALPRIAGFLTLSALAAGGWTGWPAFAGTTARAASLAPQANAANVANAAKGQNGQNGAMSVNPSTTTPPRLANEAVDLGNAFAAIIDQVKGSVVSVLSEKMIQLRANEFGNPFDDPFFRQFFGDDHSGEPRHPHHPFGAPEGGPPGSHGPHGFGGSHGVPVAGLGSGFLLDEKGHILTNNHVVQGMEKIRVVLADKESFTAKVLGSDAKSDIAVIQIQGKLPRHLSVARLGDSDTLKAGHLVLAFGAPFGLTQTVTHGIISATGRSDVGIADFEDFLQTDAPVNPGNSGGPLVNMRGEVIGINTAIATSIGQSAGVGFAIPVNMAKDILPTLLQGKKVVRGMLGVGVQDVTPALAREFRLPTPGGALVSQVAPGSPGEKAGLRPGDVIVRFAGKPVTDSTRLREMVSRSAPGSREELVLIRDGKQRTLPATLGELSSTTSLAQAQPPVSSLGKFGIDGASLNPDLSSRYDIKEKKGVVITDVDPTSPAGMAGLSPGDVITEVDRRKVDGMGQANQIISKSKDPGQVLLLVDHQGQAAYVTLETG